jgi:hypothetical protein
MKQKLPYTVTIYMQPFCMEKTLILYTAKAVYHKFEQINLEIKLRGLSSDSYIYVSVSDLYIPTISLPILASSTAGK